MYNNNNGHHEKKKERIVQEVRNIRLVVEKVNESQRILSGEFRVVD